MELVVLAIVGLIVLGPDKLPGLARDAARMVRTLRELASGARTQLQDELGPEFADLDLRGLNPRVAIQRAILGEEGLGLGGFDPRQAIKDAIKIDDDDAVNLTKPVTAPTHRPLARGEQAPFDADAT